MKNEFITKLGYKELTDLISETKELLILSLPNIYDELCQSILEYGKNIKDIRIIVDNSKIAIVMDMAILNPLRN